jgi:4-hydroxybenzoate polyprenyltransferase
MKILQLMRPAHWMKNVFVFAGLIFGRQLSGSSAEVLQATGLAMWAFLCFCLASSGVYIMNDIVDRRADQLHPVKGKRPIAAGQVSIKKGFVCAVLCVLSALGGALMCGYVFVGVVGAYVLLMVFYSLVLRHIMILDVMVIALGFCLRAIAGAVAVDVFISPWLMICTFTLCLFMGFGKRRSELVQLGQDADAHRQTLAGYSPVLLDHMLNVSSGVAVVCFLLYAMDMRTYELFKTDTLVYTTPMVLFCIFRFSALVQQGKYPGPVDIMLHDIPFQISFLIWIAACIMIIYKPFFAS